MTWNLAHIYRHPVKSLGEEALDQVDLTPGASLPWDRRWAIAHAHGAWSAENPGFLSGSRNLVNQTQVPRLAQITASFDEATQTLSLSHPDLDDLAVVPSQPEDQTRLMDWIAPLTEGTPSTGPFQFCDVPGVTFTDFEDTHISIATLPTLRALEQRIGQSLAHIRFRMNLWLDGPPAWSELDWVGKEVEIGSARLAIIGRDERCNATNANPSTGTRDTQIPATLRKDMGHMDFGVYAQVVQGGIVRPGDAAKLV